MGEHIHTHTSAYIIFTLLRIHTYMLYFEYIGQIYCHHYKTFTSQEKSNNLTFKLKDYSEPPNHYLNTQKSTLPLLYFKMFSCYTLKIKLKREHTIWLLLNF